MKVIPAKETPLDYDALADSATEWLMQGRRPRVWIRSIDLRTVCSAIDAKRPYFDHTGVWRTREPFWSAAMSILGVFLP
jgi:hypothetical protein